MLKLQFKHQKFQADAAKAVVDVFAGQPYLTPTYLMDRGTGYQQSITDEEDFTGWRNERIVPELTDKIILEHLQKVQRANQIKPSDKLEGHYNLTIEMETGVGKTYTYIKTMYELNKHYGWSKFIVVVPSIAIREGVYKSFQVTQEHFAEEYGKKIRFFIYNSARLTEIDRFASDSSINVMIINSQAFNAKGKDARRIYMKLDEFRSRRPIEIIAKTNPILIIDEPQSVEGVQTKERLKEFHPLLTLRYSATHKADSIYNMVYRLDAMEAYNKRLVKKIAVKGITESGSTATEGYVYLEGINLSKADPTATIQFDYKGAAGIRKKTAKVGIGFNLYDNSGNLDEYKNGFVVKFIDGRDNSVEFLNGIKIFAGDVVGKVSEEQLRRIQIRETILSHIERERQLFHKGIKVLSLFFIDEVAKYKQYDEAGNPYNGIYLTDKYYGDKANGEIKVAEEVADSRDAIINILDSVYDSRAMQPENARSANVELQVDPEKLAMPEFKALWKRISPKSVYVVDFDTDELVKKSIDAINLKLHVPKVFFKVETGTMEEIKSKDELLEGSAFSKSKSSTYDSGRRIHTNSSVKYDLVGKIVSETGLTRKAVVDILVGIDKTVFEQFSYNPEEFIIKASDLINDEKATAIVQHITYNMLDERYDTDIFTEPTIKGRLGVNAMKAQLHLYDHIVYDSTNEHDFAAELDTNTSVAVYVKLPDSFYIATPVGRYNPDWAIAFYEGTVKHIYFVAETKGSMSSLQLRDIEKAKIHCAREHFKAISSGNVVYDVVDSYQALLDRVMK